MSTVRSNEVDVLKGGEYIALMSSAMRKAWVCDECEHEWLAGEEYPKQCPNRGCRSRRWNAGGGPGTDVVEAVESGGKEAPRRAAKSASGDGGVSVREAKPVAEVEAVVAPVKVLEGKTA